MEKNKTREYFKLQHSSAALQMGNFVCLHTKNYRIFLQFIFTKATNCSRQEKYVFASKKKKKSNDFYNDATKADSVSHGDLLLQLQFRLLYVAIMTHLVAGSSAAVQQLYGVLLIFRNNLRAYVNMYV